MDSKLLIAQLESENKWLRTLTHDTAASASDLDAIMKTAIKTTQMFFEQVQENCMMYSPKSSVTGDTWREVQLIKDEARGQVDKAFKLIQERAAEAMHPSGKLRRINSVAVQMAKAISEVKPESVQGLAQLSAQIHAVIEISK